MPQKLDYAGPKPPSQRPATKTLVLAGLLTSAVSLAATLYNSKHVHRSWLADAIPVCTSITALMLVMIAEFIRDERRPSLWNALAFVCAVVGLLGWLTVAHVN